MFHFNNYNSHSLIQKTRSFLIIRSLLFFVLDKTNLYQFQITNTTIDIRQIASIYLLVWEFSNWKPNIYFANFSMTGALADNSPLAILLIKDAP